MSSKSVWKFLGGYGLCNFPHIGISPLYLLYGSTFRVDKRKRLGFCRLYGIIGIAPLTFLLSLPFRGRQRRRGRVTADNVFLNPTVEYRNKCIVQKVQTWACLFVCFVWPRTFEHLYLLNWLTTRHPKENFLKVSAQSIKPLKRSCGHIVVADICIYRRTGGVYRLAPLTKIVYKTNLYD